MTKVNFRTHVLLKSIIGKDLITDDNIAVLELVKNSFDAGSNTVNLEFINLLKNDDKKIKKDPSSDSSKLLISDTGIGMSGYDLVNKWLNIAYSEKKEKREEYGRVLAGNKGVGRFSCDRLGRFLTIYTRKKNEKFIKLFIDWKWFEKEGDINLNIQDVDIEMSEILESSFQKETGIKPFKSGTILEISGLREFWSFDKILSLKKQLERLINPNQSFKSTPFEIVINAHEYLEDEKEREDYEKINGPVKNRIFDNLNFKTTSIQSTISDDGSVITTTLQDRGNEIFELKEKNRFSLLKSINIFIYYLNPYSKAYFTRQTGIRSVDFGSIFLFINGFRIPPYGDEGDDWLGMESRKGQGYNRYLGTREVVGRIEIKDEQEQFKIISSRTGVRHDESFLQLTKTDSPFGYYYKIFRRLERFVVEGIKWDSIEEDERKVEKRILNDPDWNESKEVYNEDSLTRNKRVIEVVKNIIDAKKDEIISLRINDSFVEDLIEEQTQKVQNELEQIAEQLKEKNLSPEEISSFLEKINLNIYELKTFSTIIAPYKDNSKELEKIEKELDKRYLEIEKRLHKTEEKLKREELARQKAEEAKLKAEEDKKKAEEELEIEKKKTTYLLATRRAISKDADGLIHNIKLNTTNILSYVNVISNRLKNEDIDKESLLKYLGNISVEAEKCLTISKFITRADINDEIDNKPINIPKYIEQYCEHYNEIFDRKLSLKVENIADDFYAITNILDLSLIFDNLFSNALKWNATKIIIDISETKDDALKIVVNDNGDGLLKKYLKDPEKIFELGVNENSPKSMGYGGSGIGAYTVKKTLTDPNKNLKGDIRFLGNGIKLKGASFEIILRKKYKHAKLSNN